MKRTGVAVAPMLVLGVMLALTAGGLTAAQESVETDEEALFGEPDEATDQGDEGLITDVEESPADRSTVLLSSEGVELGGRFRFEASSSWTYDSLQGPFGGGPVDDSLLLDLGALVFLDARPSETFRVFGKTDVSYPFTDEAASRSFADVFHVRELFSDFQLGDAVFFRAGKQTATWGVGYFFSPADLLNITAIDPEDPEAELEGPVALKTHVPVGAHNIYLYTVFEDAASVNEVAVAPKAELVVGATEIGLGGFYRKGDAPAAMVTLTTSVSDFNLFAEGVLSYGSDRTFVVEDAGAPLGVSTRTYDETFFPSATAGFRYRWSDDRAYFDVSVSSQYLYNGDGYEDPDLLRRHAEGVEALVGSGKLSAADLVDTGRHYGAVNLSWTHMFGTDFTVACLWLGNLADGSGMVTPSVRLDLSDYLNLAVKSGLRYGAVGEEYNRTGEIMSLSLSANLGTGSF